MRKYRHRNFQARRSARTQALRKQTPALTEEASYRASTLADSICCPEPKPSGLFRNKIAQLFSTAKPFRGGCWASVVCPWGSLVLGRSKLITCSIHSFAPPAELGDYASWFAHDLGRRRVVGFSRPLRRYWVDSNVFGGRDFFPRRRFGMGEMPFGRISFALVKCQRPYRESVARAWFAII